jgi:tetratricopeptide (TPR) repeat protein
MRNQPVFFKKVCNIATFLVLMGLAITGKAAAYDFFYWERGAIGHESALYGAELSERPLILYFHIPGDVWSERLNNTYLATEKIEGFLLEMYKVAINPDSGEEEMALSSKYGVTRYPAFLVSIPAFKTEPERVHPFAKEKDMSVDDFLLAIKGKIAHILSKKAFASFESKAYEVSLKYYKLALDYDPKSFYVYFSMGMAHEKIGVGKESIESLLDAETTFLKALEIDPNHKDTKAALENVRKNIAILRER